MKKISSIILGIIGLLLVIAGAITKIKNVTSMASVIGGADGSTSIFVAGKAGPEMSVVAIAAGIILVIIAIVLYIKREKSI